MSTLAPQRFGEAAADGNSPELPTALWRTWSCQVRLVVTEPAVLDAATADLSALLARVDRAASRFRVDSELSRANANAGRPVAVSATLAELVETALHEASRSHGALDPTLGRELRSIGYDRDISLVGDSDRSVPDPTMIRPSWRAVRLDRPMGLLTVPTGCSLDLGASAKARTADLAASELAQRYGCSVLVELGGDIAVAGPKSDWQITVAERAGEVGQQVSLAAGGMATSTTTVRQWRRAGELMHHIVNPNTGRPADGPWRTVTVAAGSATRANTCSTAAIVRGAQALGWLREQHVAARLVSRHGDVVTVGGWPMADQTIGESA